VWAASEYRKLPAYDQPTAEQPIGVFMCHQADQTICAGWASVHGDVDNLALRMAVSLDRDVDRQAVLDYTSPVPLFGSGAEAARHGMAEIGDPGVPAREAVAKLTTQRRRQRRGTCRVCRRRFALTKFWRIREHNKPGSLARCPGAGAPPLERRPR
jgi:hypothetical protein